MKHPAADAGSVERRGEHAARAYPGYGSADAPQAAAPPPAVERRTLAARRQPDVLALHLAHRAAAPHRGGGRSRRPTAPPALPVRRSRRTTSSTPTTAPDRSSTASTGRASARPRLTAEELMERVAADPDCVAPTEFASFRSCTASRRRMRVGDEYRGAHGRPVGRTGARRRAHADVVPARRRSTATSRRGRSASPPSREDGHDRVRDRVVGAQRRPGGRPALRPAADGEGDPAAHVDLDAAARRRARRAAG